jgi:hypothetical protein
VKISTYLASAATAGLSTPARIVECECPTEHTVSKLGHSRSCPWFEEPISREPASGAVTIFVCGGRHQDGTPHDFEWATYSDDTVSTGVCRCGMWALRDSLWRGQ